MSEMKPAPLARRRGNRVCPVCGKPSYSREGIHPQCSVEQAEMPHREQIAAEKKEQELAKKKPQQKSWNKKCPKCHVEVHVRLKTCTCGYEFRV